MICCSSGNSSNVNIDVTTTKNVYVYPHVSAPGFCVGLSVCTHTQTDTVGLVPETITFNDKENVDVLNYYWYIWCILINITQIIYTISRRQWHLADREGNRPEALLYTYAKEVTHDARALNPARPHKPQCVMSSGTGQYLNTMQIYSRYTFIRTFQKLYTLITYMRTQKRTQNASKTTHRWFVIICCAICCAVLRGWDAIFYARWTWAWSIFARTWLNCRPTIDIWRFAYTLVYNIIRVYSVCDIRTGDYIWWAQRTANAATTKRPFKSSSV